MPQTNLPSPPAWLTSPLAIECLIPFTEKVLDNLMPGLGRLADIADIAKFYTTFYTLLEQRGIPVNGSQVGSGLYWKTLMDALEQQVAGELVDDLTLQNCRNWAATIPNG